MTNAVIETLMTRRSVRAFQEKAIPADQLQAILETARFAPSGMGRQTWKFTAVTNREKIQKLAAAISKELGREGYNMYQPEVLIIPSNDVESPFGKEDNACALENIFIAAWSFGIGSVWSTSSRASATARPSARSWIPSEFRKIMSFMACSPGLSGTRSQRRWCRRLGKGQLLNNCLLSANI